MYVDEYELNDLYLRIPLQFFADSDEKTEEPTAKRKSEARKIYTDDGTGTGKTCRFTKINL